MSDRASMEVHAETHARLRALKDENAETFDAVIRRLLSETPVVERAVAVRVERPAGIETLEVAPGDSTTVVDDGPMAVGIEAWPEFDE